MKFTKAPYTKAIKGQRAQDKSWACRMLVYAANHILRSWVWRHVFFPTTTFQTVTFQTQLSRPPSFQTIQLSRLPIFQTIAILSSFPDLDSRFSRLIQIYFFNLLFLKLKNAAFRETAIPLKLNGRLDAFFQYYLRTSRMFKIRETASRAKILIKVTKWFDTMPLLIA